jgi:hypothetical protein
MADLARRGAADRAVELFVRRPRWDDESPCWRALADLANRLDELERKTYGKASRRAPKRVALPDLSDYHMRNGFKFVPAGRAAPALWEGRCVLRAEEIGSAHFVPKALFAVSGGAKVILMSQSVLFSNGSVQLGRVSDSLVVCDGDCTVGIVSNSLIIARGTVCCRSEIVNSRIITCGDAPEVIPEHLSNSKVVGKEPHPLGFVKFFEPTSVGIRVASADGGARVKEVAKGQRFAAAGLRTDDLVTAVNGTAVTDAETFRRLLRAGLAGEDEMVLKVSRADKFLEVRVPSKD